MTEPNESTVATAEATTEPLATEMYKDLKKDNQFLKRLVILLILMLAATNIYHIHKWSQFDSVIVESGEGSGNANYVQGDNSGGIFNGESSSTPEEGREIQGDAD